MYKFFKFQTLFLALLFSFSYAQGAQSANPTPSDAPTKLSELEKKYLSPDFVQGMIKNLNSPATGLRIGRVFDTARSMYQSDAIDGLIPMLVGGACGYNLLNGSLGDGYVNKIAGASALLLVAMRGYLLVGSWAKYMQFRSSEAQLIAAMLKVHAHVIAACKKNGCSAAELLLLLAEKDGNSLETRLAAGLPTVATNRSKNEVRDAMQELSDFLDAHFGN